MGMTIDESMKVLQEVPKVMPITNESINVALETMRKYQKIQEIYQWAKDRSYLVEADDIMDKLKEVVEDGNNNQHN